MYTAKTVANRTAERFFRSAAKRMNAKQGGRVSRKRSKPHGAKPKRYCFSGFTAFRWFFATVPKTVPRRRRPSSSPASPSAWERSSTHLESEGMRGLLRLYFGFHTYLLWNTTSSASAPSFPYSLTRMWCSSQAMPKQRPLPFSTWLPQ